MNKFFKIAVAATAVSALATPAFAVTADISGFIQAKGFAYDNLDGNDDIDDNARAIDQRARLFINGALNENVKAVFGFEVDNVWGDAGTGSKEVGKMGTDSTSQWEIKHLYVDFTVPEISTNFKAGSQYFKLGRGLIIADDAAGLFVRSSCPMIPNNSLGLFWIKTDEVGSGDANASAGAANDASDGDYYHLQYDMKFGDQAIAPYFGYYDMPMDDDAYFIGADYDGKFGAFGLSLTAIYNDWDTSDLNNMDGSAVALWGKGTYKMGATLLSLESAWYGDDDNGGEFFTLTQGGATGPYNNFSEIVTGGRFDTRSTIASAQTVAGKTSAAAPYGANYFYVKAGAEHKINDKNKISGYYIYSEQAEDPSDTVDAVTFGHEINAYYDYTIMKGLTFTAGGGYLFADDDFGDIQATAASEGGDDAWKVGTSILYQF